MKKSYHNMKKISIKRKTKGKYDENICQNNRDKPLSYARCQN